jgi:hypothetical protein
MLKPEGLITMEFPHLMRLIKESQFDTIYHEHFSYLSFATVEKVFAAYGPTLFDVEELPTHGGSLRIYARHSEYTDGPISQRVIELKAEAAAGLTRLETYLCFAKKVEKASKTFFNSLSEPNRKRNLSQLWSAGKGKYALELLRHPYRLH